MSSAQHVSHLGGMTLNFDWSVFLKPCRHWWPCCLRFHEAGGRVSGYLFGINNEVISEQYSSLRLSEENWYEFLRTNKNRVWSVVAKTMQIVVDPRHVWKNFAVKYSTLHLKHADSGVWKYLRAVQFMWWPVQRDVNRICTGINLTYCSIYGGLAVNLPKVKPSWDLSVLDQTRKTTFAWSKINRTKSTNRKMNLIEKLFRKSPRNGGTDKKIVWRDRLEYLMKPTTFVHLWLTVASVFCPVSLCDR